MKMSTATAIFALAALAAPAAVGQSHLPFHPMQHGAATDMVQVSAKSVLPWSSSRSFDLNGNLVHAVMMGGVCLLIAAILTVTWVREET